MGIWDLKTPRPSSESILVRPKVYSHLFETPTGLDFIQARHGFTHFDHAEARWARTHGQGERKARESAAKKILQEQLHTAIRTLLTTGEVKYMGKPRPTTWREAVLGDREVGEFLSSFPTATLARDPAMEVGPDGRLHWKPLGPDENVAMTEFAMAHSKIDTSEE